MIAQSKSYAPPAAVRYGTVRGLTASTLKCSPGTDSMLSQRYAEFRLISTGKQVWVLDPSTAAAEGGHPQFLDARDGDGTLDGNNLIFPSGCTLP